MEKKPLTSRQLAKMIGVSQSTISRTFSKQDSVSPETRAKVIAAARQLGYRPNAIARILSKHTSDIVGLVTADIQSPLYLDLLDQLSSRMQAVGLHPLLFNLPAGADGADQLDVLRQYNVRNVVVISGRISHAAVAEWAEDGRSVILVNRNIPDAQIGSVRCDNIESSRMIADHFYELGHRRVAFVGGPKGTPTSTEREAAFTQRVAELGMTLCAVGGGREYLHEAGVEAAKAVMDRAPDGIFFANDRLAIGGLFALRGELGLRVPGDVSIVGFDDIAMAAWTGIELTTVRQDVVRIAEATMDLLEAALGGEGRDSQNVLLPCELIIRRTTGPAI
ncbi:LacI family DNA-binding transcriptional regulator [Chelativorans sp. AA-79]|uniref:LacI family DNA-binding transcriptional regulator n=1 Tax=Chelativorans sp. AA-79 TaxID=3028735 RepID=UPI0023F913FD|nr:LacI family DNA-binding transcriptional regulator [Chelativorans sp. AA-79]WEX09106.1 LacI family DNA-binding transcriptional regulator [Chelativorans sp. AA-79]